MLFVFMLYIRISQPWICCDEGQVSSLTAFMGIFNTAFRIASASNGGYLVYLSLCTQCKE
jgi:hypothetical protein